MPSRPRRVSFSDKSISILDVAAYHQDAEASLRLYFTDINPNFIVRFFNYQYLAIDAELANRLNETDLRSALAILTRLEAAFRIDYLQRCQKRKRDALSKAFRDVYKIQGPHARLHDDIFATWRQVHPQTSRLIGELAGALNFRHWLAHGSYWEPKLGRNYDYQTIYALADSVLASFPLHGRNA